VVEPHFCPQGGDEHPPAIAIVGATACGKSKVAEALAKQTQGVLVGCDSVQVYRQFDIGSAKPSLEARQSNAYELIDVVDWHESFDAQLYRILVLEAVATRRQQGYQPIICGGTGLYLRALRFGLLPVPASDLKIREELQKREEDKPGSLYERLVEVDPASAQRIGPSNLVQLTRALEIYLQTGKAASVLRQEHSFTKELFACRIFCLRRSREQLHQRIAQRVEQMLKRGWIDEVETLLSQGIEPTCKPMQSVGYRQIVETLMGKAPIDELCERIVVSTRRYAKRQGTWFRSVAGVEMVDIDEDESPENSASRILSQLDAIAS
jgi:tRNA dimethylallyltransferase